jgi:hypothetical protein
MNAHKNPLYRACATALVIGVAVVALMPIATHAQNTSVVVWSTTNFVDDPLGPYGSTTDFAGTNSHVTLNIVTPGEGGAGSQAMEIAYNATNGTVINLQTAGYSYPASGNTSTNLANYTISFDMQVNGANAGPFHQGFQIGVFGPGGSVFGPPAASLSLTTNVFNAGTGWQHYSFPLSSFANNGLNPTATNFKVGIGFVSFPGTFTATPETFDINNLQITMDTNPVGAVVWSTTNFINDPVGLYGTTTDFGGGAPEALNIVDPGEHGPGSHAMELTFNPLSGNPLNFQSAGTSYPASGNTNAILANYEFSFDMQVKGVNAGPFPQGFQIQLFGPGGGVFAGPKVELDLTTNVFAAGAGWQHYSFLLSSFNPRGFDPTATNFTAGFGVVSYAQNFTATPETFDFANLQLTVQTNPPPPPQPIMIALTTKPGLRIFGQNFAQPYNQEGFSTVNENQSWVGAAPLHPSYSITFGDFDTVNNYTFYAQFVQGGNAINPFIVFSSPDAFVWSITRAAGGFTTAVNYKLNGPNSGQTNNLLNLTTTSLNGRGTWNLTFTSDSNGIVTAPDGTQGSFAMPPADAEQFANPLNISFGTAPNNTGGYGQFIDINQMTITNLISGENENDNFTQDASFNTGLGGWDPNFSLDPGSVILVPNATSGPSYWLHWNVPDQGFGLETKAFVNNTNIPWFSPGFYSGGTVTLTPTQMGPTNKWVLIPATCLPTVDGTTNGTRSTNGGFFRLSLPPPAQ